MPMNDMRYRGSPPGRSGPAMCENPNCDKPALKGKRYCSMCLALVDANAGALPKPPPEPEKK